MKTPDRFCLAGVMGWPVAHSLSPLMHNFWLAQAGLKGVYVPLAIEPQNLERALRALPALGFAGCNLTIPHKEAALAFLDAVEPAAAAIGAVNCVVVAPDGSLYGRNTDAFGFTAALQDEHPAWRPGPSVVLGAGGAARAVIAGLIEAGVREVRLANRSPERARALAAQCGPLVRAIGWESRAEALAGAALLVNTTSAGMAHEPTLDIDLAALPAYASVVDIIYAPRETALLRAARARGLATQNGLGMLIHQARPAFAAWFGLMPEATPELRAMLEAAV